MTLSVGLCCGSSLAHWSRRGAERFSERGVVGQFGDVVKLLKDWEAAD
jgi:hypothetical protein